MMAEPMLFFFLGIFLGILWGHGLTVLLMAYIKPKWLWAYGVSLASAIVVVGYSAFRAYS